jgi:hypothetical protein
VEQNQSWHSGSHPTGNSVEQPVANNHSLIPDFSSAVRSTSQDNKVNTDGTALMDENVDSITQQLLCNVTKKQACSSLLQLNR